MKVKTDSGCSFTIYFSRKVNIKKGNRVYICVCANMIETTFSASLESGLFIRSKG